MFGNIRIHLLLGHAFGYLTKHLHVVGLVVLSSLLILRIRPLPALPCNTLT